MATNVGAKRCQGTIGTTADLIQLTDQVKQVAIINKHATQTIEVKVYTGSTAAAALAAATDATDIVAGDDESFFCPPANVRTVVFRSSRPRFVALEIIASGASTTYAVHGTEWYD